MTSIVLVETNGTVKQLKAKDISVETLYKKCGFRVATDFGKRASWVTDDQHTVELWAKDDGKANNENKYDFPPPVDTALYFGTCALIRVDETGNIVNLPIETWTKIYEKLFGGFEDIGDEDEFSEDELENVSKELKTKHGYLKDGFVVDTATNSEEDEEDGGGDEDEETTSDDNCDSDKEDRVKNEGEEDDDDDELNGSELEEEEYEYSDEEEDVVEKK
jgi:hypothetical protein